MATSAVAAKAPPRVVFVLGGPGAGKGTQCARIQSDLNFKHISAGDELRAECNREGSQYGDLIRKYIKDGAIVPVKITCMLLRNAMIKHGWSGGKFIIDGFPRNQDNLDGWFEVMPPSEVDVKFCLFIDCDEKCMEERLLQRGLHSGRIDDNIESVRKRFKTYVQETLPIIAYFEREGKCKKVDGTRKKEEVFESVKIAFAEMMV